MREKEETPFDHAAPSSSSRAKSMFPGQSDWETTSMGPSPKSW